MHVARGGPRRAFPTRSDKSKQRRRVASRNAPTTFGRARDLAERRPPRAIHPRPIVKGDRLLTPLFPTRPQPDFASGTRLARRPNTMAGTRARARTYVLVHTRPLARTHTHNGRTRFNRRCRRRRDVNRRRYKCPTCMKTGKAGRSAIPAASTHSARRNST